MEFLSSATAEEHSPQRTPVADSSGDVESALLLHRDVEVCLRRMVLRALCSAARLQVTLCELVEQRSCAKDLRTPCRPSALRHQKTAVTLVWRAEPTHRFVLDKFEMRTPLAESTWRNTHPHLTSPAEMILSRAVLGDLRDLEAMKIGKQLGKLGFPGSAACKERIGTQWQLDLFADLKAGFEGVRHEADTDTCVRFIEDSTVSKHRCEHEMQSTFPGYALSHTHEENGRVPPRSLAFRVQTVGGDIKMCINIYVLGPVGGRHR